jgi:prepilin-type N-terminal cleavage/methylation domain-containing protein
MAHAGGTDPEPEQLPPAAAGAGGAADGFSLLEVLVATALMGLVMVVVLQLLTTALRCQDTSWGHTQAVLAAEKVLQENCEVNSLKDGTYQGDIGRFKYVVRVAPQYEVADPLAGKHLLCSIIQVTVTWQERDRPMSLTLATVRTSRGGKS